MLRHSITLMILLISILGYAKSVNSQIENSKTIRYDIEFTGNRFNYFIIHKQTKLLNVEMNAKALPEEDLGNYRYRIVDIKSGKDIFQRGFSNLFGEWLTTPESSLKNSSFYYSLFFPVPTSNFLVNVDKRNNKNIWENIYSDSIDIENHNFICEKPDLSDVDTVLFSGSYKEKIQIVILSEGYREDEMQKFSADARRMTDSLFSCSPFKEMKNHFNILGVKVPSLESGSDIPQKGIYKNTALNSGYNTFDTDRYLTTFDSKSIYDAIDGVSWDFIIILVNTDLYGGGGFYNHYSICSAGDPRSTFVFIHEFGHSFAGLADEYYNSEVAYDEFYNEESEPWELNITTMNNFKSKWGEMIFNSTPIPTPRDPLFKNKIGVFEGGGYVSKGVYSPYQTCWMKESAAKGFCPVCAEIIKQTILKYK